MNWNGNCVRVAKFDDYTTPKSAWESIAHLIPKNKVIWESFFCDGKSGDYLRELGFDVIHENIDFFTENRGDIIVSNPPFSKSKEVFARLLELDKPFVIICPVSKLNTSYMRTFKDKGLQIIIPKKRIHFTKLVDGKVPEGWRNAANFDCLFYCYKIGLTRDIMFLD